MTQKSGALGAPTQDLCSIPSTNTVVTASYNSSSRGADALF